MFPDWGPPTISGSMLKARHFLTTNIIPFTKAIARFKLPSNTMGAPIFSLSTCEGIPGGVTCDLVQLMILIYSYSSPYIVVKQVSFTQLVARLCGVEMHPRMRPKTCHQ